MEMGCIGFLLGAIVCLVFTGIGVGVGYDSRCDKSEFVRSDSERSMPDSWNRNRGSDNGSDKQVDAEEIELVLYNLRIGASNREKAVIDYLLDEKGAKHEA